MNWYPHWVHAGETGHTFILFSGEAWFHLRGYMNTQIKRFPIFIYRVPCMTLGLVGGVKLGLLDHFLFWDHKFILIWYVHSDTTFQTPVCL
jgi:hypothetical protein